MKIEISEETKAIAEHIIKLIRNINQKLKIQSFIAEFGAIDVFVTHEKHPFSEHVLQISLGTPNGVFHRNSGIIRIWRKYPTPWWQGFILGDPGSLDEIEKYVSILKEEEKCQK